MTCQANLTQGDDFWDHVETFVERTHSRECWQRISFLAALGSFLEPALLALPSPPTNRHPPGIAFFPPSTHNPPTWLKPFSSDNRTFSPGQNILGA